MARVNQIQYVNFYTAGSAAQRVDTTLVRNTPATLPKPRRKKRIIVRVDPVAVLGMVLAAVLLIGMLAGVAKLCQVQEQEAQMAAYVASLEQRNAELEQTYRSGYDLEEIRQIALAMGMVPASQAQHIQVQVTEPTVVEEPTAWESFCIFLTGLFA